MWTPYDGFMNPKSPGGRAKPLPVALTHHAGYLAVRLGHESQRKFEMAMAELELRPVLYDFISTLGETGPCSQNDLASTLGVDAARIVALTDEMEKRGIALRTVDPEDRRRNLISLTKSGQALLNRAHRISKRVEAELLDSISTAEQETLRKLLRKTLGL